MCIACHTDSDIENCYVHAVKFNTDLDKAHRQSENSQLANNYSYYSICNAHHLYFYKNNLASSNYYLMPTEY